MTEQNYTQKIVKYLGKQAKRFSEISLSEIETLVTTLRDGTWATSGYNFHKVNVDGQKYLAADAKSLNKAFGNSGRGNYRFLFGLDYVPAAVAVHRPRGDYSLEMRL